MSETVASEIWGELKRYVNTVDRDEAAEAVVAILIDNDSDVEDIRTAFKGDADIKRALAVYLGEHTGSLLGERTGSLPFFLVCLCMFRARNSQLLSATRTQLWLHLIFIGDD